MRVAMITSSVSRLGGGLFTSVRRLGQSLQNDSSAVSVHVLSTADAFVSADIEAWAPLDVRVHSHFGPWGFRYTPGMQLDLQALDADMVHVQHLWMYPSVVALRWHARTRRPYVVSPRGMIDEWAMNRAKVKKWIAWHAFEKVHLTQASCIHALGDSEVAGIRRSGIRIPICVIPNGIDIPGAAIEAPAPSSASGRLRLLFLGRLHPKKGIAELLAAWQGWRTEHPGTAREWELVLAGWGEDDHVMRFKRYANELEIGDSVSFAGPRFGEDKIGLLKSAAAFVLPSFSEGLPMAVLEAWAYKLPVLITPQCNLADGVRAGAAICVEPSVEGIRQGLNKLGRLSGPERRAIGYKGYELVAGKYSWPKVAAQMSEIYRWVLGGGQAPATVIVK